MTCVGTQELQKDISASLPYSVDANMSSLLLPSLSPNIKAPTEPVKAPNKELLTTSPDCTEDRLCLQEMQSSRLLLVHMCV